MATIENNRTVRILKAASEGNYGVLAAIAYDILLLESYKSNFYRYNVEQLTALVRAAEAKRSPLIIQLFPSTLKQLPLLAHAAAVAVKNATVPLSLHIDHAQDENHIREIIATLPVDSVMVDMSHYDEEENLAKTTRLTKECHEKGIAVEAESGRIEGGEDGIADTGDLEGENPNSILAPGPCILTSTALFTSPEDVDSFIAAGVDILAPSVGNVHGDYGPGGPKDGQIHFDRLEAIDQQINKRVLVALHGTNDFPPEVMQRCIRAGAVKLNVNKLLLEVGNEVLRSKAAGWSLVQLIDEQLKVIQAETERWMDICGSSGKA
jgi:fructose-bisphosphate aldolase class II